MKLVCIGDSLTTGYGVFRSEGWTEILKDKYGFDIINKGINGDTTAGMLDRFHEDVILSGATHVMIMGGCNDLMSKRELRNVKENLKLMAEEANKAGIISVLAVEPPIIPEMAKRKWSWDADYDYAVGNSLLLREWLLVFCSENNIKCVDLYGLFEKELRSHNERDLYIDGLHPKKLGHELIAGEIAKTLGNN